jgi:subtilase family serine protease
MAMKTMVADSTLKFHWVCALVAAVSMIVPFAKAQPAAARIPSEIVSAEQSTLKNSLHPLAQAQNDAGRMPAETRLNGISIVFSRSAGQEADLKALIAAQQNQASPLYHQWLNPDQFAARFGMADADLDKVQNWLQQQGFSVDSVARSKNAIHFTGTVRQVEQAFSTEMHFYKVNGVQHFAPSTALSVPSALAGTVLGITNLDDFRPKSHALSRKNARARPSFTGGGGFGGLNSGAIFFAPGDIKVAYDINPLYNAGDTGTGQSITLVGQSAIQNSDIEAFQSAAGLATKDPIPFLVPGTGSSAINPVEAGDEAESDLDLEWSGAIAPDATINFVYTGNSPNAGGAFESIQYAIDEKIGTIISTSFGVCEAELGPETLESSLEQGTAQGQTIMAAAGDDGSFDCSDYQGTGTLTTLDTTEAVDYPASSPNVTGMGGTEIDQSSAKYSTVGDGYWQADSSTTTDLVTSVLQYIPEVVWNDDALGDGLSASGGGVSTLFSKPSYQTALTPADDHRDVPDLALYASPNFPGYLFCTSDSSFWTSGQVSSCTSGFEDSATGDLTFAGGTSFDGPIFSGMLALINQKQGYATGQGLINPTLYTLAANSTTYASAFHDITSGNNDCTAGSTYCGGHTEGFSAKVGYDQVSGLGSVDVNNLAGAWPVSSTTTSLITTTTTITASNTAPNVNASDTFTITVAGASGTPTGSITLTVDTNAAVTETLTSNGTFVYTTSFATAGAHTILAAYVADSTYAASSASVTVNVSAVSSGVGTITLTSSPSTLTVSQGNEGTETITVTPSTSPAYTGTVYLTLPTLPTALNNLCGGFSNVNSAGDPFVAISSATTPGTNTLILDTNASDCASGDAMRRTGMRPLRTLRAGNTAQNSPPRNTGGSPLPLTVAFAGLLLAGFMGRASRKLRGLAGLILLAAVGLAVTACGSNVSNTVPNPAQGTYSLTVIGTDSVTSTITSSTTFTFVIN